MDVVGWLRKQLETASPDLVRVMVQDFVEALMGAEADALCGASYGERSPERVNRRNGYRERGWDTRVGSIELAVSKLREGSYFPEWLLQPRRRAERALVGALFSVPTVIRGISLSSLALATCPKLALCRHGSRTSNDGVNCYEPCGGLRGLTQDWFGDGLFEAGCSLNGKRTGDFL